MICQYLRCCDVYGLSNSTDHFRHALSLSFSLFVFVCVCVCIQLNPYCINNSKQRVTPDGLHCTRLNWSV